MLELIDIGIDNAVAFRMNGKITKDDMTTVLSAMNVAIERYGQIHILERIDSLDGVELAAIAEEFKYLLEVGFSNISKIAILADKKWVEHIVAIEDKLFRNIDIRYFHLDEQEQAIDFLRA